MCFHLQGREMAMNGKNLAAIIVKAAAMLVLALNSNAADTHYVDAGNPAPDSPFTNGWASASTNIAAAIAVAGNGDTVLVTNGYYTNSAQLSISSQIWVRAVSTNPVDTVIDGNYPAVIARCVYINASNALISGFTISNGCSTTKGGGVYIDTLGGTISNCLIVFNTAASSTFNYSNNGGGGLAGYPNTAGVTGLVIDCTVRNNIAVTNCGGGAHLMGTMRIVNSVFDGNRCYQGSGSGGGALVNGTVRFEGCSFSGNRSMSGWVGGGIYNYSAGNLTATGCVFTGNWGGNGGGVAVYNRGRLYNCVFIANTGGLGGGVGGTRNDAGPLEVVGCYFASNYAGYGAGICSYLKNTSIRDCIIENNSGGAGYGGGIYLENGAVGVISNCVIRNTTWTSQHGGGVRMVNGRMVGCLVSGNVCTNGLYGGAWIGDSNCVVESCTIVGNSAKNGGAGMICTGGTTVRNTIIYGNMTSTGWTNWAGGTYTNCCSDTTNGMAGVGNIAADPLMVDTNSGNYRLRPVSPCVNAGLYQDWMSGATDLDGQQRIRYGMVDMGAYECLYKGTLLMFK